MIGTLPCAIATFSLNFNGATAAAQRAQERRQDDLPGVPLCRN